VSPALRVIRADDECRLERMFYRLSPESVYRRFFTLYSTPPKAALHKLADLDHDSHDAVVAVSGDEVVGVARYAAVDGRPGEAEIAVVVEDAWQGQGLGPRLLECVAALARVHGVTTLSATVLAENRPAIAMLRAVFPDGAWTPGGTEYAWRVALRREQQYLERTPA
jgi:GNAT superfamily N-acetyltransferase